MRVACAAAAVVFLAGGTSAQIPSTPPSMPAPPRADGVVIGQVIDGTSGRPVAGALVNFTPAPGGLGGLSPGDAIPMDQLRGVNISSILSGIRQAIADEQGRFAFTGLTRATYSLQATKPGWSGGGYGQRRPDGAVMPLLLTGDARAGNITLQLWKNAAAGGTVVDEAGEPIVGIAVRALRRTWLAGRPKYAVAATSQTDDRGMYRISGLRPGEYVFAIAQTPVTAPANGPAPPIDPAMIQNMVMSNGPGADPNALLATMSALAGSGGATAGIRVGDWSLLTSSLGSRLIPPATADGRMTAYRTTFYPTAPAPSQAQVVTLDSGEDHTGVDFQLKPVPVALVSGTVTGPDGPAGNIQVRLVPSGSDELASDPGFESALTTTMANGAFAFVAVPPGTYTARVLRTPRPTAPPAAASGVSAIQNAQGNRAVSMGPVTMDMLMPTAGPTTEPTLWASVPISVGNADITDTSIALRTGYRVSGRAEFEGTAAKPTPEQMKRIAVVLDRAESGAATPIALIGLGQTAAAQLDENGQFQTSGAAPGRYFIRAPFAIGGWVLKSATVAGRDAADAPIELENSDISGVTLTFTDRSTEVSGTLRGRDGRPANASSIVIFPVQPDRWVDFGSNPRAIRTVKTDATGHYRLAGVPPGDYFLGAVQGDVSGDWQNPGFLETLSRTATKISIGDGEKKVLDVAVQ